MAPVKVKLNTSGMPHAVGKTYLHESTALATAAEVHCKQNSTCSFVSKRISLDCRAAVVLDEIFHHQAGRGYKMILCPSHLRYRGLYGRVRTNEASRRSYL